MNLNKIGSDNIYFPGRQLELRSHRPPLPFGIPAYRHNRPVSYPPIPAASDNQSNYVFRQPPMLTEPPNRQDSLKVIVTKQISSGKSHGPQVILCNVAGQPGEVRCAKIYDPLYYQWSDGVGGQNRVTLHADGDYSRETAAYAFLCQQGHNGTLAPKYYGSWTFTLTRRPGERRLVRMILLEHIPAPSLWQEYYHIPVHVSGHRDRINPNEMTKIPERYGNFEGFRAKVYEAIVEITAKQLNMGLAQRDIAPRNVLAVLRDSKTSDLKERLCRVVLVDYNASVVKPISNVDFIPSQLPSNPLQTQWEVWLDEYDGWVPRSWKENREIYRDWLYETFGSQQRRAEYMPLSTEFSETLRIWRLARAQR